MSAAAERIRRFERLGGVSLGSDPEDPLRAEVESGIAKHKKAIFWFRCPICRTKASNNMELEPMCTGPLWTDDHEPTPMVSIDPHETG